MKHCHREDIDGGRIMKDILLIKIYELLTIQPNNIDLVFRDGASFIDWMRSIVLKGFQKITLHLY